MSGNMPADWEEADGLYRLGDATAERFEGSSAFVITSFGADADPDTAFGCIVAAMRFGLIVIRADAANRALARQLADSGRVRFSPYVGLPFDALGVMAVKTGKPK